MNDYDTFLFARPSFFEGMARVLDLGDTLTEFNRSITPAQANNIALRSDWQVVGNTIRKVAEEAEETEAEAEQ